MTNRIYNFSAGPAILPEPVIKNVQQALWSLGDSGIGICEHSHRGAAYDAVQADAEANLRKLAGIGDSHAVLFLQGGASSQFFMAPMNFLAPDKRADYVDTGVWSKKAIAEAERFGEVRVIASSKDNDYCSIPSAIESESGAVYLHYTSNNTIAGTQFHQVPRPAAGVELFCDASSDILSQPIEMDRFGMVYAGAQKNLGPSGLTLVVVKRELVAAGSQDLPTMLQYRTHADKDSRFNTPPTFAIYVLGEVLKWLIDFGGLAAIAEHNASKAAVLYDYLDESSMFSGAAQVDSRSEMNITFRSGDPSVDSRFVEEATARGFSGLKGHRSIGGMRASIYNAFPREGVDKLVEFMKEFEIKDA